MCKNKLNNQIIYIWWTYLFTTYIFCKVLAHPVGCIVPTRRVSYVLVWLTVRDHYTDTPYTWDNSRPPQDVKICQTSKCYRCHKSWGSVPLSCWMLGCAIRSPPWRHDNPAGQYSAICCQNMHTVSGDWTRPSPPWPAYSPDKSPIDHVWDLLDYQVRQRVANPAMSMNSAPFKQSGPIFHSCHHRQPGVVNAQAMYCTVRCYWTTDMPDTELWISTYDPLRANGSLCDCPLNICWISVKCLNSVT